MRATANSFALVRLALVPQLRITCCPSTAGGVNNALQEVRGRLSAAVASGSLSTSVRIPSPAHCRVPHRTVSLHRFAASLGGRFEDQARRAASGGL